MSSTDANSATRASPIAEFPFSAQDFERVRHLIRERAGISLQEGKQAMVYGRLARRLRDTGHASFTAYLNDLEAGSGPASATEWQAFVNCLTTNLTAFFREAHHFDALRDELRQSRGQHVRIWCNAASTGEEPYSLAITAMEAQDGRPRVSILATDIDTQVLSTAERGVYDAQARGLGPEQLKRHFMRGTGRNAGLIRVKPELARLIEFRTFNLMSSAWNTLGEPFDIVFCRNVMIYFDAPTQRRVLEQIHGRIKPGGLLYVGHSENFTESRDLFTLRGKTIYQRS